jgi:hypothetical protein
MTEISKPPQQINIQLDIDREVAKGSPSNLAFISHSQTEFFFDFALLQPAMQESNVQKALVSNRIVMSPIHAKQILKALTENIQQYEKRFGIISEKKPGGDQIKLSMN